MHKRIIIVLMILISLINSLCAQTDVWNSPDAYLGQTPPGITPIKFAPNLINDTPFFSLDRCAFSPDGKAFYYCSNNTWFSNKDASVKAFTYDGGKWVGPSVLTAKYYAPVFSMDGKTIYFAGGGQGTVMQMHRKGAGWDTAETYINRSYGLYDFMPTISGNGYAASNVNGKPGDYNCYDICQMPASINDTSIKTLGKPLNTPGFDGDFFVAPDESYIIISAKEQPDFECELFISYHKKDNGWTNPKSLGPQINNGPAHRWGQYVPPGNKYLFYSYGHSPKDCAIYWVRFDDLLENLKHTNYEPYVKDSIKGQSVNTGQSFNMQIPGETFFDDDGNNSLTYTATIDDDKPLPAGFTFNAIDKILSAKLILKGTYKIKITATDNAKAVASSTFLITAK